VARYVADVRFIASIYPGKAPALRRNYGPSRNSEGADAQRSTLFVLEPVPRGGQPFVLPVYDSFESVRDFVRQAGGPRLKFNSSPVDVDQICNCLLNEWAGGYMLVPQDPPAKPGIMVIEPLPNEVKYFVRDGKLPTPNRDELEQMNRQQTAWFEFWFAEGEKIARGDHDAIVKWSNYTPEMRLAAEWLGHRTRWSDPGMMSNAQPCPWCGRIIPPTAYVCEFCNRTVREVPPHLLRLMEQEAQLRQGAPNAQPRS
jgi:hypothetical protein